MIRTNAAGLYGFRTALYGTLLPAPMIALSFPDIVRRIIAEGHEVQLHAWDHRRWQDELPEKSEEWIRREFEQGMAGFEKLTGNRPTAFGAPSWSIDDRVLAIIRQHNFDYISCTRANAPFIHEIADTIEIPSDLPCFEELARQKQISFVSALLKDGGIHILPVHAEVEGGILNDKFRQLLKNILAGDNIVLPLNEIRARIEIKDIPVRKYKMALIPGRHSPCAV
jgi:peptidoglycan/xylan/chitin deacetylase (PgdA/CDA1 family)